MNEQPNLEEQNNLDQMRKRVKRIALITGAVLLGVLVLGILFLLILNWILPKDDGEENNKKIKFYPVTDENIFESAEYLGLDRAVYYCADPSGYGITEPITDADRARFPAEVQFLEVYLMSVISGDNETYRSLFSEAYLKENQLPSFTQQMLYNICIYKVGAETGKNGEQLEVYRVDYMIRKNNGTFRQDVESDAIRPQYVVLSRTENNSFLIENVYVNRLKK